MMTSEQEESWRVGSRILLVALLNSENFLQVLKNLSKLSKANAKRFLKDLEASGTSFQTIKFCMQLVSG
jgi:Fic family protein